MLNHSPNLNPEKIIKAGIPSNTKSPKAKKTIAFNIKRTTFPNLFTKTGNSLFSSGLLDILNKFFI